MTATNISTTEADAGLIRAIGVRSATLLVITNVIGSAIFLTPGVMAATLPSEPLLLLAWVAGGVIALCGGLTYAEMGAMYPRSGGLYVFLEHAYGPLVAFLFGWACMLVILTGGVATVAVGFATYFSYFVPSLSTTREVVAVPMPWGAWSISAGQLLAATSILALGAVNYTGVKSGNRLQATLTVVKIAALAAMPIVALALHPVTPSFTPIVPPIARPAAAFGIVMIAVMWAYEGWYFLPFCAGEIENPDPQPVPQAVVRRAGPACPVDHVHIADVVTFASHQRRKKPVQTVEIGQRQKDIPAERLEPAAGIAGAVAQHGAAHSIGEARLKLLEAALLHRDCVLPNRK